MRLRPVLPPGRANFVIAATVAVAAMLFGGASRGDVAASLVPAAIGLIALLWLVWTAPDGTLRYDRMAMILWIILFALPIVQLIPLPWSIWTALPAREHIVAVDRLLGQTPWRPISLAPDRTMAALLTLVPAFSAFLLAGRLDGAGRSRLLRLILFIAIASALLGLVQASGRFYLYDVTNRDAGVGLFANANHQGLLLAIGCAIAFGQLREALSGARRRPGAWLTWGAAMIILVAGSLAAGSRAGYGLIAIAFAGGLFLLLPDRRRSRAPWVLAGCGLAAGAVLVGLRLTGRLPIDPAHEDRLSLLPVLGRMIADQLPFGSGVGTFEPLFRSYETLDMLRFAYLNHAHNDYAEIAIEAGFPGIAAIGLFCIWWLRRAGAAWREAGTLGRQRQLATLVCALCLLHSLVDYPLRTAAISVLFAIGCALLANVVPARAKVARGEAFQRTDASPIE